MPAPPGGHTKQARVPDTPRCVGWDTWVRAVGETPPEVNLAPEESSLKRVGLGEIYDLMTLADV